MCRTSGDTLLVTLGKNFQIVDSVEIAAENGIRRAGTSDLALSPTAMPVVLPLSRRKVCNVAEKIKIIVKLIKNNEFPRFAQVLEPRLSLTLPTVICTSKMRKPHLDVKVVPIGNQKLTYEWSVPALKTTARTQRENLMLWRSARNLERALNTNARVQSEFFINSTLVGLI